MNHAPHQLPARQTFLLILLPLLATFVCQRLCLHVGGVRHVHPGGYLVHHLFFGILLLMPASFLLAFGPRRRWTALAARVAVGIGSAMILDEVVFLVATNASDADYISGLSFRGALVFVALGISLLWIFYKLQPDATRLRPDEKP